MQINVPELLHIKCKLLKLMLVLGVRARLKAEQQNIRAYSELTEM